MKSPTNRKNVFAIVPAFNEEENILEITSRLSGIGVTPIVVNDHSTDRTAELAKSKGVTVINHTGNSGKGHAMRAGLDYLLSSKSSAKFILFIDADMQYNPESAKKMLDVLQASGADIVTGYREWDVVPFRHRLGNFVWRSTFNTLFGTRFKDTNCGLMAMRRAAADKIKDSITGGYIIENSMFIEALKNNLRIEQVPVPVTYKKISKIKRGVKTVSGVLWFIVKEGINYRLGRK